MKKWTLALVAAACLWPGSSVAQTPAENTALRQQIERRFDVLLLTDRVVLRPRSNRTGVRSIEITDSIALDGIAATGAEIRAKLGTDADPVLQLSYLDAAQRRALFDTAATPPASPTPPAPPTPPVAPAPPEPPAVAPIEPSSPRSDDRERHRRGDQVRFGGDVSVDEDEVVMGNVIAIGGSVRVDGEVRGEVVAVGGGVELGPKAVVTDDVAVIGGTLRRAPGARIQGELHEVGIGDIDFGDWQWGGWGPPRPFPGFNRALALMSTLGRVAILCVMTVLVVLLGREYVDRASIRAASEPLKAGAIGFLAQLLFLPVLIVTIIILIVTIVGIPLLLLIPFALLGLAIIALLGFTAIAYRVGQVVSARMGWGAAGPYAPTILGVLVVVSPLLLARLLSLIGGPIVPLAFGLGVIAFLVEYVVWTIGFGAVALARFDRPRPPTLPIPAPPPVMP